MEPIRETDKKDVTTKKFDDLRGKKSVYNYEYIFQKAEAEAQMETG